METSDNAITIIVTKLLTTENYATWSRSMEQALCTKNKLGFINFAIPNPSEPNNSVLLEFLGSIRWYGGFIKFIAQSIYN